MALEFFDITMGVLLSGIITGALISGVLAILQRREDARKMGLQYFANIYPQYFDENIKRNRLNARRIVVKWREDRKGTIAVCEAWFLESGTQKEVQDMMEKKELTHGKPVEPITLLDVHLKI